MNSDVGAPSLSMMPLVIDAPRHGHQHHHSHHHSGGHSGGHSGEPGGGRKTSSSYPFCGADAKVACIALTVAASASLAIAAANVFLFVRRARLVKRGETLEPASPRAAAGNIRERLLSNSSSFASSSTARGATPGMLAAAVAAALAVSRLVSASSSSSSSPPRAPLFSALARLCAALALAVSQARRGLSALDLEEDALVTRALLAGPAAAASGGGGSSSSRRDVEAPAGPFSALRAPSRGWISLLGVAIAFVWPEEPAHQVSLFLFF